MDTLWRIVPRLIPVAALVFGVACQTGDTETGTQTSSANTDNPPAGDVTLDTCAAGDAGWIKASGLIVNHSSKPSTYFVSVEFVAADVRYGEGMASSSTVAPGQQVEWEASGLTDARPGTECRITTVERFAS